MSENKQKHATPRDGKSKYAMKMEAQNRGIFSPNSPFQSSKEAREQRIKQAETQKSEEIV